MSMILTTPALTPNSRVEFPHIELPPAALTPLGSAAIIESAAVEPGVPPAHALSFEAEVAAEAYALFEARGCEHGHDVEDWVAAEALVRQRRESPIREA